MATRPVLSDQPPILRSAVVSIIDGGQDVLRQQLVRSRYVQARKGGFMLKSGFLIATMLAATSAPTAEPAGSPLLRYEIRSGRCRVTALSDLKETARRRADGGSVRVGRNSFLLLVAGHHVLIGPSAAGSRIRRALSMLGYRPGAVDTVIMTSLDDDQTAGMVEDGHAAYPDATLFVDRWSVDGIGTEHPATPAMT